MTDRASLVASQSICDHDIIAERWRQLKKWGPQSHPDGTGGTGSTQLANDARAACDRAVAEGEVTWRHILLEEVFEALAESDHEPLRAELTQVAATCVGWIQDLDERAFARVAATFDPAPVLEGASV